MYLGTLLAWQPPGYVHQMIDQTWAPSALNVSATAGGAPILANTIFSAQKSTDGKTLVLRYVNFASGARTRLFCFVSLT